MNKSSQVRAIYKELRNVYGNELSQAEVLQYAHSLVEICSSEYDSTHFELRTGGTPFENWSLDAAFADGGWRTFWYEYHRGTEVYSDEWEGVHSDLLSGNINLEEMTCRM